MGGIRSINEHRFKVMLPTWAPLINVSIQCALWFFIILIHESVILNVTSFCMHSHTRPHTLAHLTRLFNVSCDPAGAGHSWAESMGPLFRTLCSIAHSCWIPHIHTYTHLTHSGQLLHPWTSPHMVRSEATVQNGSGVCKYTWGIQ